METNQGEMAKSPTVRFIIGTDDSGSFSENRKPDNAVLNAATERFSLANFLILPLKQAELFGSPAECYIPILHRFSDTARY